MTAWFDPRSLFGDTHLSVQPDLLPLQADAKMMPAPVQKPKDDNDLPIVPDAGLRNALMGKFDEPDIPSGVPTDEQQKQAMLHRLIGNATANSVSSLQNTANILRPGAGNPQMAEAARQHGEALAQAALGNAQARRQEALQNFQLKDLTDQHHERMFKMAQELKQQRDMQDPTSELSRTAQQAEMQRIDSLAAATPDPQMRSQLAQRRAAIAGLSAARLAEMAKTDPTEKLMQMQSTERAATSKLQSEEANRKSEAQRRTEETALGWANLHRQEKHDADELAKANAKENQLKVNEDNKTEQDIKSIDNTIANLKLQLVRLENGSLDNSKEHFYKNEASKTASAWGAPTIPDKNLQDLVESMPLAQGTIEKSVTGSSRWVPQRWKDFTVYGGEGNENSKNKLKSAIRYANTLRDERLGNMHVDSDGNPISSSAFAKNLKNGEITEAANRLNKYDEMMSKGLDPYAENKSSKNPNDSAALKWANAHPDDPRSALIKQHLGVQ